MSLREEPFLGSACQPFRIVWRFFTLALGQAGIIIGCDPSLSPAVKFVPVRFRAWSRVFTPTEPEHRRRSDSAFGES